MSEGLLYSTPERPTRRGITLIPIGKHDPRFLKLLQRHYSRPKGVIGRQLLYAVVHGKRCYGVTVGGSATRFLPGRKDFLGDVPLNSVVNNTFFHVEPLADALGTSETRPNPPPPSLDTKKTRGRVLSVRNASATYPGGKFSREGRGKRVWNYEDLKPKLVFCREVGAE